MTEAAPHKTMTEGEAGLVMAFSILALLALVGAAKAEDGEGDWRSGLQDLPRRAGGHSRH